MMCKLNHQASEKTPSSYGNWTKYQQVVFKLSQLAALVVLLGIGNLGIQKAIAQEATATTRGNNVARVNLAVNRQAEETYESLVSRAETVAMSALKQRFHQDKHIPAVSVVIVGQNQGAIAPVLAVEVDRNQWQKAQTKDQIKVFTTARQLLGFDGRANDNSTPAPETMREQEDPEVMQDMRDIENYNRAPETESNANSSDIIPELDNVQAPAIVPVDTPTPEVPGMLPIDAPVSEADTNPDTPMMPSSDASNPNVSPVIPSNPTPSNPTPEVTPDSNGIINTPTTP